MLEPFLDSSRERWHEVVDTHLFDALLVARAFLAGMIDAAPTSLATPEESARRILGAVEAALV